MDTTAQWEIRQTRAFCRWVKYVLSRKLESPPPVRETHLQEDLSSGRVFILLMSALDSRFSPPAVRSSSKFQHLQNHQSVLEFIGKNTPIHLVGIGPQDLVAGNTKLLLGLLWMLALHYQVGALRTNCGIGDGRTAKRALLSWVQEELASSALLPDVLVNNFSGNFCDGRVVCALVESQRPGTFPESTWKPGGDGRRRCALGIRYAEELLRVPSLLDAQDLADGTDELSVMLYVSCFQHSLCGEQVDPHLQTENSPTCAAAVHATAEVPLPGRRLSLEFRKFSRTDSAVIWRELDVLALEPHVGSTLPPIRHRADSSVMWGEVDGLLDSSCLTMELDSLASHGTGIEELATPWDPISALDDVLSSLTMPDAESSRHSLDLHRVVGLVQEADGIDDLLSVAEREFEANEREKQLRLAGGMRVFVDRNGGQKAATRTFSPLDSPSTSRSRVDSLYENDIDGLLVEDVPEPPSPSCYRVDIADGTRGEGVRDPSTGLNDVLSDCPSKDTSVVATQDSVETIATDFQTQTTPDTPGLRKWKVRNMKIDSMMVKCSDRVPGDDNHASPRLRNRTPSETKLDLMVLRGLAADEVMILSKNPLFGREAESSGVVSLRDEIRNGEEEDAVERPSPPFQSAESPPPSRPLALSKDMHTLGDPRPGRYPWSKTYVCSCGAVLSSLEIAELHLESYSTRNSVAIKTSTSAGPLPQLGAQFQETCVQSLLEKASCSAVSDVNEEKPGPTCIQQTRGASSPPTHKGVGLLGTAMQSHGESLEVCLSEELDEKKILARKKRDAREATLKIRAMPSCDEEDDDLLFSSGTAMTAALLDRGFSAYPTNLRHNGSEGGGAGEVRDLQSNSNSHVSSSHRDGDGGGAKADFEGEDVCDIACCVVKDGPLQGFGDSSTPEHLMAPVSFAENSALPKEPLGDEPMLAEDRGGVSPSECLVDFSVRARAESQPQPSRKAPVPSTSEQGLMVEWKSDVASFVGAPVDLPLCAPSPPAGLSSNARHGAPPKFRARGLSFLLEQLQDVGS